MHGLQRIQQNKVLQRKQHWSCNHSQRLAVVCFEYTLRLKLYRCDMISLKKIHLIPSDLVSRPDISFTVLKEDSHNYSAMVTCESTKGTPPVTFSLYNRTELVANMTAKDRNATFKVPLVLGKHMGDLQCRANNGDATEHSKWIPIVVGMCIV